MNILVTGASGYIASRLIPRLLEHGHRVRALARRPQLLHARGWYDQIEVIRGDVMDPSSLTAALHEVHTAYYLIHNMSAGHGYTEIELQGARNFAAAAGAADLRHIIYLGGLADPKQHIAPHMRSRIETGATLRAGSVPVTEFRAGVVVGDGSISFEMIRFMTELFPLIPGPRGLRNKSQPIATQNIIDYLLAALENWDGHGRVFEIGGPEATTYQDLMLRYAKARGLKRGFLILPYVPNWFMAFGIGLMTPVPYPIAYALVDGLSSDSLVMHDEARETFPEVRLIDYDSAASEALKRLHPHRIERVWEDGAISRKILKHEGFFIDHREVRVQASPSQVFQVITSMGGKNEWPFANWLWRLRGGVDRYLGGDSRGGGVGMTRENLQAGDRIDFYVIEDIVPQHLLLLHSRLKAPGDGWMEWRVVAEQGGARLSQTAYFAPRGLPGFLYWFALYPFHAFVFRGLIRAIARRAQEPPLANLIP